MKRLIYVMGLFVSIALNCNSQTNNGLTSFIEKRKEVLSDVIKLEFLNELGTDFEFILSEAPDKIDTVVVKLIKIEGSRDGKFLSINESSNAKNLSGIQFIRVIFLCPQNNKELTALFNIGSEAFYKLNDFSRIIVKNNDQYQLFLTTYDYSGNILWCGRKLQFNIN